jgi:L-alanine-DL-glutamate epimerase-like enolase superfamily enzyme
MFKQLLASGAIEVCRIDACRVAGVNENLTVLLLAAKFGVPACPHAGVGLREIVQHLSMFDLVAASGVPMGAGSSLWTTSRIISSTRCRSRTLATSPQQGQEPAPNQVPSRCKSSG